MGREGPASRKENDSKGDPDLLEQPPAPASAGPAPALTRLLPAERPSQVSLQESCRAALRSEFATFAERLGTTLASALLPVMACVSPLNLTVTLSGERAPAFENWEHWSAEEPGHCSNVTRKVPPLPPVGTQMTQRLYSDTDLNNA